jgi:hypothetical protein
MFVLPAKRQIGKIIALHIAEMTNSLDRVVHEASDIDS